MLEQGADVLAGILGVAHSEVQATALLQRGALLSRRRAGPLAQSQVLMGEQARIAIVGGEQLTQFGVG